MACKPCEKKKTTQLVKDADPPIHAITCGCGLTRMLPVGIQPGDLVELVPCPKCGSPLKGIFTATGVQT